jgi:hypothetical protein
MPIPPSLDPDRVSLLGLGPEVPCPEGECVELIGDEGATDPEAVLIAHRLLPIEPDLTRPEIMRANELGAFEILLGGPPEGVFRMVIHGEEGAIVRNLEAVVGDPGTPWPVIELDEPPPELCLTISGSAIDFGAVPVGGTATAVIELENTCEELVFLSSLYVVADPEPESGESFGAMAQINDLAPGEVTPVVVAFWPRRVDLYRGALIIEAEIPFSGLPVLLSHPVRGEATSPER